MAMKGTPDEGKEINEDHRILTILKLRDFCELEPRVDTIE